jgi:endo-1,4-beta-xylanase
VQCKQVLTGACQTNPVFWHKMGMYVIDGGPEAGPGKQNLTEGDLRQYTAEFMLTRGPYAMLGYSWYGCTGSANDGGKGRYPGYHDHDPPRAMEWDVDFGEPSGPCKETAAGSGRFSRNWGRATVTWDCATNHGDIEMKAGFERELADPPLKGKAAWSGQRSVPTIDVEYVAPYLGKLAAQRHLRLGAALIEHVLMGQPSEDRRRFGELFGSGGQFYLVSPDSAFKWHWLETNPGHCNWSRPDAAVADILKRGASVRGSAGGVWPIHNPAWLAQRAPALSVTQLRTLLTEHITAVVGRYKGGRVLAWDIVNEPLVNFPPSACGRTNWSCALFRDTTWSGATPVDWTRVEAIDPAAQKALGAGAYLALALQAARAADGHAELMINEYNIHSMAENKTHLFLAMVADLLEAGAPLDGVGIQMHLEDQYSAYEPAAFAEVVDRINALGLDVHISELDVAPTCSRCYGNATTAAAMLARQGVIYASVLGVCLRAKRCSALVMWSATDAHTDRGNLSAAPGMALIDNEYRAKPALFAMADALTMMKTDDDNGNGSSSSFTIDNLHARLDTAGRVIDAHSGNILEHNGTYFMYGDHYESTNVIRDPHGSACYTSTDMQSWTLRSRMIWKNGSAGVYPLGGYYTPSVLYDPKRKRFVGWVSGPSARGCTGHNCSATGGGWSVGVSSDGITFSFLANPRTPSHGNMQSVFIDDDGVGYMAYRRNAPFGIVYIAQLSDDYTSVVNYSITASDPDKSAITEKGCEGVSIFKRRGRGSSLSYYLLMGSGCCQCKWGSNLIVWQAPSIRGPWRRSNDINPIANSSVSAWCATAESHKSAPADVCRHVAVNGQLNAIGVLRKAGGGSVILALIDRWMTAPDANPAQNATDCSPASNAKNAASYVHGNDFQYWVPLQFSANGNGSVVPLRPFEASIRVQL